MIRVAITFFIIALVAALFGAYGIAGLSMEVGRVLVIVFLVAAVVSLLAGTITG